MNNQKNPLVSVIIPTYNRGSILREAIESVLNQTYKQLELIVVDDGSTDNTEEVLKSIEDERFEYIQHDENQGPNTARNTGLEHSSGEYISYLDSDAVLLPNKIEKQVEAINSAKSDIGVIYCSGYSQEGEFVKKSLSGGYSGDIYADLLAKDLKVVTSTMLIKRECFDKCGDWDPNLPSFNEYDLCLRFAREYKFKQISEPLLIEISHDRENITSNLEKRIDGMEKIIDKWGCEMKRVHGPDTVSEFEKQSKVMTYRESSIWEVKSGNKIKGAKLAYSYFKDCNVIDIKFLVSFLFAFLHPRAHRFVKQLWYRKTGEKRKDAIEQRLSLSTSEKEY